MDLSRFPYLQGNYAPVAEECDWGHDQLRIEGRVPDTLKGAFLRNGPNPAYEPNHYVYPLDGDGMVHAVYFDGGRVHYRNRWVQTPAFKAEQRAGRRLYGSIGRPLPVPEEVIREGGDPSPYKNTANTNILQHAGHLFALWEGGWPHALTSALDTIGPYSADGLLKPGDNLSAHPKICPDTGEMITCSQPFDRPMYIVQVFDRAGQHVRRIEAALPWKGIIHDLQITRHHVVIFCAPVVTNPALLMEGKFPMQWREDLPMKIGVIPRAGGATRWFEAEPFFSWHFCNGFEDGSRIVIDYVWIAKLPFAMEMGTGVESQPRRLYRLTLDTATGEVANECVDELFCEFTRVDDRRCGQRYRYGYAAASTMPKQSEYHGYNATARFDLDSGEVVLHDHGEDANAGEPVFVPHGEGETDGYVMAFVTVEGKSSLVVLDAAKPAADPVARIHIPTRVPNGFHANWAEGLSLPGRA